MFATEQQLLKRCQTKAQSPKTFCITGCRGKIFKGSLLAWEEEQRKRDLIEQSLDLS